MRKVFPHRFILFFFPHAVVCGFTLNLLFQVTDFTFNSHTVRISFGFFILLFIACLFSLFTIWDIYFRVTARIFRLPVKDIYNQAFLNFIPLLFLFLLPLTLNNYLTAADLNNRIITFLIVIIAAIIYLQIIDFITLSRQKQTFIQKIGSKFSDLSLKKKLLVLFIVSLAFFNASSVWMVSSGTSFSGDEPHYLLITHSLLADGDMDLSNNYAERDYTRYMQSFVTISPHTAPGTQGKYSFHSPGISLVLLPFYALGNLLGESSLLYTVRFGMSLFGALLGLQCFLYVLQEWKNEKLALVVWFLFSFTTPILFHSIHVYPEIVIAFFAFTVFRIMRFSKTFVTVTLFLCGLMLSLFVWFHAIKYIFILGPLFLYSLFVLLKKHKIGSRIFAFLACPIGVTLIYFFWQYSLYGSLSLSSVSWKGPVSGAASLNYLQSLILDIPFRFRWETLAGYFLDQKDGLLLYAPFYFFAFLGMAEAVRRNAKTFLLILFIAAPYILNTAFLTQRSGYAPQARPITAISWALAVFLAYFLMNNSKKAFFILFGISVFFSFLFTCLLLNNPRALYQLTTSGEIHRGGLLFENLSSLHFRLTNILPSFLKIDNSNWLPNYIWIAGLLIFVAVYLIIKKHDFPVKKYIHHVVVYMGLFLVFFGLVLFPRVLVDPVENISFPSGEKIMMYEYSRAAKMIEPGGFLLFQGNRDYTFYFSSWRKISRLAVEAYAEEGQYDIEISSFDVILYRGKTQGEPLLVQYPDPPSYNYKKANLYCVSIMIQEGDTILSHSRPFHLNIRPVKQTF